MLEGARKWIAIRRYAKSLGPELRKRYGRAQYYTPAQVKRVAEERRYNMDLLCYALCMYCGRTEFDTYHRATGEPCDYDAMRGEVAERFFGGDASFTALDVVDASSSWSDSGGAADSGSSGDGGGGDASSE
jgi:hypothetical protein